MEWEPFGGQSAISCVEYNKQAPHINSKQGPCPYKIASNSNFWPLYTLKITKDSRELLYFCFCGSYVLVLITVELKAQMVRWLSG